MGNTNAWLLLMRIEGVNILPLYDFETNSMVHFKLDQVNQDHIRPLIVTKMTPSQGLFVVQPKTKPGSLENIVQLVFLM